MFNIKSRKLQNQNFYNNANANNQNQNQNRSSISSNTVPTLQCTPRQTLVGNVVQITC